MAAAPGDTHIGPTPVQPLGLYAGVENRQPADNGDGYGEGELDYAEFSYSDLDNLEPLSI